MVDVRDFRQALGSFVTGVTIVTARDATGQRFGLTANSFNSVSLDPPMVLWSLALRSASLPVFREATSWAVHILAADQQALSDRFARPGTDRFADLPDRDGPEGAPLIDGYAARFGCRARFEYEGGDHAIFLGEVTAFDRREAAPLVYHSGRYAQVLSGPGADDGGAARAADTPAPGLGDFLREGYAEQRAGGPVLTARGRALLAALEAVARG